MGTRAGATNIAIKIRLIIDNTMAKCGVDRTLSAMAVSGSCALPPGEDSGRKNHCNESETKRKVNHETPIGCPHILCMYLSANRSMDNRPALMGSGITRRWRRLPLRWEQLAPSGTSSYHRYNFGGNCFETGQNRAISGHRPERRRHDRGHERGHRAVGRRAEGYARQWPH